MRNLSCYNTFSSDGFDEQAYEDDADLGRMACMVFWYWIHKMGAVPRRRSGGGSGAQERAAPSLVVAAGAHLVTTTTASPRS